MQKLSSRNFPAKLLLFGEYSVLFNSKAIVIPFRKFSGELVLSDTLSANETGSHRELWWLYSYCLDEKIDELELSRMKKDLQKGMWFQSNIPQGSGLGSSGALVAAIFWQYAKEEIIRDVFENKNYQLAKKILAKIESHFHEKSSGVDPLSSLLNNSLLINNDEIEKIDVTNTFLSIDILDSQVRRQIKKVVSLFFEKCDQADFLHKMKSDYFQITNDCVDSFLKKDSGSLRKSLKKLSSFQLNNFEEFIPHSMTQQWREGLRMNNGFFKLCGAGGGGHILKLNC